MINIISKEIPIEKDLKKKSNLYVFFRNFNR